MLKGNIRIASFLIGIAVMLAGLPLRAELDDLEAEERVKKLLVSSLDPALPREPLATWVARVAGPKGKVFWEVNDCGEQSGDAAADANRDFPACVQASLFVPDGREFGVLITVGTWQKGFVGSPRLRQVYWAEGQQTHTLRRLGQIPDEIRDGPADDSAADNQEEDLSAGPAASPVRPPAEP